VFKFEEHKEKSGEVIMQLWLEGFPEGSTRVGSYVSVLKKENRVTYFVGEDNYYWHLLDDTSTMHVAIVTLIRNHHMRVCDAERDMHIPRRTLMNWLKRYDKDGCGAFLAPRKVRRTSRVLSKEITLEAERLLSEGYSIPETSRKLGILETTLRKGVNSGRVTQFIRSKETELRADSPEASDKSERSIMDAEAAEGLGTACTRVEERTAAAMGQLDGATLCFEEAKDVQFGGLLVGLPALCENGLLSGLTYCKDLPKGFYKTLHIVMVLAYMALARLRRPEALRHNVPGELGKVMGLDRVPEVSTLREKIKILAPGAPEWMKELSSSWMEADPDEAGYLYVDGHIRVYNGSKAKLPKRFVSRDRLCLRGTTDYWVNDSLGRPFFVVSQAVTDGMGNAITEHIVPELLKMVPNQPSEEELNADPKAYRFVMIFDRECSNYKTINALWEQRIAAITYRKNVKDKWDESEFKEEQVTLAHGEVVTKRLAFRETDLTARSKSMKVLEIRCLSKTGHQTAIITTARTLSNPAIAGRMFSRWCQENFFAYMMEHYDIDGLVEYGFEELSGTIKVVNPVWRKLDKQVRDTTRNLRKKQAKLVQDFSVENESDLDKKAVLLQEIQEVEQTLGILRAQRKQAKKKVELSTLPEDERPTQLRPLSKQLTNAIKMIAYRAETALVQRLIKHLGKIEDARALVREIFVSSADIYPDINAGTLTVKLHRMASPTHDKAVANLLHDLNKFEFRHPETALKIVYQLVGFDDSNVPS
jgi:transposase-like protein